MDIEVKETKERKKDKEKEKEKVEPNDEESVEKVKEKVIKSWILNKFLIKINFFCFIMEFLRRFIFFSISYVCSKKYFELNYL